MNSEYTEFLFAQPSFFEGISRILDFGNSLSEYNTSATDELVDQVAIALDYAAVAADLRRPFALQEQAARSLGKVK